MGVPGFNSWFRQNHPTAYVPVAATQMDHIYIDMNSVLHLVLRRAKTMDHFHSLMFIKLDSILTATQPRRSVLFALDGPAPLAKLITQRARRKKSTLTVAQAQGKVVPPLAITPGTSFMQDVHNSLQYYICQRLIGQKYSHLSMELSGSTVQGEGEVKILSRLQRPLGSVSRNDTHALIGNDSDLLIMALLSEARHVYVFSQIMDTLDVPSVQGLKVFSVDKLHAAWKNLGPARKEDPAEESARLKGLKQDLALTCILGRGNDYLPAVQGASSPNDRVGPSRLWESYLTMRSSTPEYLDRTLSRKTVNGKAMLDVKFLSDLLRTPSKLPTNIPGTLGANVKPPEPAQYLDGLCWVMDMYHAGVCPDYRFLYDGQGPHAMDLVKELSLSSKAFRLPYPTSPERTGGPVNSQKEPQANTPSTSSDAPEKGPRTFPISQEAAASLKRPKDSKSMNAGESKPNLNATQSNTQPLTPVACALALLPRHGQPVIPKPWQHLMDAGSPIEDMFDVCEECEKLSGDASEIAANMTSLARKRLELSERISILEIQSPRQAEELKKELEALFEKTEVWRDKARRNHEDRAQHLNDAHPYEPFPVSRIEEAVRAVPTGEFSAKEREFTKFGRNYIYKRLEGRLPRIQTQSPKRGKQNPSKDAKLVVQPPLPPSSKFKALKGPLPIQRSFLAGDDAGRIAAKMSRRFLTFARML